MTIESKVFGRWTVLGDNSVSKWGRRQWLCACECGSERFVREDVLKNGASQSCGCLRIDLARERIEALNAEEGATRTHGQSGTPEYRAWSAAKMRCANPRDPSWHNYGGRGITMDPEWKDDFAAFHEYVGDRPSTRHRLGRMDIDGDYEPGNVKWTVERRKINKRPLARRNSDSPGTWIWRGEERDL